MASPVAAQRQNQDRRCHRRFTVTHTLHYENPRDRIPQGPAYLGILSVCAGLASITLNAVTVAGVLPAGEFTIRSILILGTPTVGVVSGIVGLFKDPRRVMAWLGLFINGFVWMIFGCAGFFYYLIGPINPG